MLSTLEKVNHALSGFLFSSARKVNLPLAIRVRPNKGEAICNLETGKLLLPHTAPVLNTKTERISKDSISFIVPAIRFCDASLAGDGRTLDVELELPQVVLRFEVIGDHYERIGKRTSLAQYLIHARISYMNPLVEESFRTYLKNGYAAPQNEPESLVFRINER